MKITLIIPPSPFLLDDRVFPFLGPLQIAAVGRQLGHEMKVIDLTGFKQRNPTVIHASIEDVMQEAEKIFLDGVEGSDLIGFYSLAAQHPLVVRLFNLIKGKCITALGGPHANTCPERCLKDGFDYIVVSDQGGGGGEPGFIELLKRIQVKRVSLTNDRIIKVPSRCGMEWEGDQWPLPARDLIDLNSYHYYIENERTTSIVSNFGCPFACNYCSHWGGYRKMEGKSPSKICEEIKYIKDNYGWRGIMFYDDEINLRKDFITGFLPALKSQNIVWRAFFKSGKSLIKDEYFRDMRDSGCVQLCTGAESANDGILKTIGKGASKEDNTNFVKYCIKNGIKPKVFCQVGLPGETPDTIQELRDWLVEMAQVGLVDADVSITTPYEGAPIYETPEKYNIKFDKNELDYSSKLILYKGTPGEYKSYVHHDNITADELVLARQWVEDEFRSAANLKPLLAKDDG
jgi:radical SAM superfamily enzyme YgiQ (UPF0313 family)